jgi:hypothetical protein
LARLPGTFMIRSNEFLINMQRCQAVVPFMTFGFSKAA